MGRRREESAPITQEQIQQLLLGIEHRGTDATGICLQKEDGTLLIHKRDLQAWRFLQHPETEKFLDRNLDENITACLLHTRAWTKGRPEKAFNNHPLSVGQSAIVHNGGIHNDDALFKRYKLKRIGEVDSDIIRAIVDEWGLTERTIKELNQMQGGAAIAALHKDFPRQILLARSGNPIVLAALEDHNHLMFASEKDPIHAASRPWVNRWRAWFKSNHTDALISPMEANIATLWTAEGQEWYAAFDIWGSRAPVHKIYRCHDNFPQKAAEKRDNANKEAVSENSQEAKVLKEKPYRMKCPNPSCAVLLRFSTEAVKNSPMWKLACPSCNTRLGDQA